MTNEEYIAIHIEGLPEWYVQFTPFEFWTREAFNLFEASRAAGLIFFDDMGSCWCKAQDMPKAALAYFCKKASKYLHLNRGSHTNWRPFEIMFNSGSYYYTPGPLRLCLHDLEFQGEKKCKVDRFFDKYEKAEETI